MTNAWSQGLRNRQILIPITWILVTLALQAHSSLAGDVESEKPHVLKPGLTAYTFDISDRISPNNQIIFIQSNKTGYSPRLIGGTDQIGSLSYDFPATLAELVSNDAPVVVSGAYSQRIGGELLPLGYLKSRNTEISARFHHSWLVDTVFCTDSRKPRSRFFATVEFEENRRKEFSDCVQTGPRLFKNGKNVVEFGGDQDTQGLQHYIDTSRIQLFLCKADDDPASPLGVGITTDKIGLSALDRILPNLKIDTKKVCGNAVALSGSISAGLLINGKLVAGSGSYLLTSAIAFVRESGQARGSSSREESR